MITTPPCTHIVGIWPAKRTRHRSRMRELALIVIPWAPFMNRRRPLLDEPSGATMWSPPPYWSSGCVRWAAIGFLRFIGAVSLGSSMPPLPFLAGVLRRPEELPEEGAGP